jgi:hypothetical protein
MTGVPSDTMPPEPYLVVRARCGAPEGCHVVVGSTPVLSFGDPGTSRVATVGLNPSRVEFLDSSGAELVGAARRLATLSSLAATDLPTLNGAQVAELVRSCHRYFDRNPYRRWFDQLELVIERLGASYYDGTACHLDLVQWATDPTWAKLDRVSQVRLLAEGVLFLRHQLDAEPIEIVLLNGRAVIDAFEQATPIRMRDAGIASVAGATTRASFKTGRLGRALVIGWSVNLQSSFGVTTALRGAVAERVKLLSIVNPQSP